jgi:hypothetical protein
MELTIKTFALAAAMLAALSAFPADVAAQNNFFNSIHRGYANNRALFSQRAAMSAVLKKGHAAAPKAQSKDLAVTSCQFRPETTSPVMPAKLAQVFVPDGLPNAAEERLNVEKTLAKLYEDYQVNMRKADQEFDLARATGAYIMLSYGVAADRELTLDEFRGLVQQVRAMCAADPKMRSQSARQKQEEYEFLVIMGELVATAYDGAKQTGDRAVLRDIRKMGEDNIHALLGVPTRRLRITSAGYEISK